MLSTSSRVVSVHPHACGEYLPARKALIISIGSSPRLWGVLIRRFWSCLFPRFIPTPVGSMASIT